MCIFHIFSSSHIFEVFFVRLLVFALFTYSEIIRKQTSFADAVHLNSLACPTFGNFVFLNSNYVKVVGGVGLGVSH